ncbi:MAG: SpoIIE family protein phosphatase [Streptosporangiaceae bacterium]
MNTETSVPSSTASSTSPTLGAVARLGIADTALLQTLFQEAPLGFAFCDTDLRYRRVNDTLASMNRLAVEEHVGRRPRDVLDQRLADTVERMLRRVLDEDRAILDQAYTSEVPKGSGRYRHWVTSWFPAHAEDGSVFGVAVLTLEVTDIRRSEEALRRSEERYRSLLQATAQVVWVAAPDGRIREDSPEWRAVTGQSVDQYLGDGWLDAIHPDDRDRAGEVWHDAVRAGGVFDCGFRVRTRSGVYRHYEARAVPIVRDGEIVEWVGANTDVTPTRDAEEMRERLTEQLSAAALRTARLQQATSMLAEALTVQHVVRVITEVGRSAIGADHSEVALLDRDRLRLRVVGAEGGRSSDTSSTDEIPLDAPTVLSGATRERKPFLAETPASLREQLASPEIDRFLAHTDEQAWVGLPLLAAGAPLGALRFSFARPRRISDEERVFLEALAGQCALAVERATFFERERRTAETLQHSLLPDNLPTVDRLGLAARYLPGQKGVEIGGDWYDAFTLPDKRIAVAIGDVMGKGVKAAVVMGRVRNALRALALTDPDPAAVMTGLDRLFDATEGEEQVTTVAYAVVDPATGECVTGNAGHPPPLLLVPGRQPVLADCDPGSPLGLPTRRTQSTLRLRPGATAIGYSDGLVENRGRGLDRGLDDLLSVAADASHAVVADPPALLDFLVGRMLAGHAQDDDVTLLGVHVRPG